MRKGWREGRGSIILMPSIIGLSISDVVTLSAYGGFFKEFYTRVFTYYASTYGNNSVNAELSRNGIVYEPSVAESIFLYLLKQVLNTSPLSFSAAFLLSSFPLYLLYSLYLLRLEYQFSSGGN